MSRPNWFLAFPLNGAFVLDLPELPPGFRRFHPDDVHVTVAFLGASGEEPARRAFSVLERLLAEHPISPIDVSLGAIVPMGGSRRGYTALSALLGAGNEETTRHLATLRDPLLLAATGRTERRPPTPHATLARPRTRATSEDRARGLAWASTVNLGAVRSRLDRIALYTWSVPRRERHFQIVAEVPLRT